MWAGRVLGCDVEIVQRDPAQRGFVAMKGRWVVERSFAWLGRSRRLSKDYEARPGSSWAVALWSMTQLMLRRLHPG